MTDSIWLRTSLLLTEIEDCIQEDLSDTEAAKLPIKAVYVLNELYRQDGQRTYDLSIAVGNMTTTFSWIINKLEEYGFIERRMNANDRRSPLVYLTAKGKQLQAVITKAIGNAEVRYGGG